MGRISIYRNRSTINSILFCLYYYKGLVTSKKQKAGRNRNGRISVRRKGGGCCRLYRKINFNLSFAYPNNYKLVRIEYDPNRSAYIGLVYNFKNNIFNYIILPEGLSVKDTILNYSETSFKPKPGFRACIKHFS